MDFQRARIINQIDKKFIFITIALSNGSLIALIDQHAADERFRLETIIQGLSADVRQMQSPLEIPFPKRIWKNWSIEKTNSGSGDLKLMFWMKRLKSRQFQRFLKTLR